MRLTKKAQNAVMFCLYLSRSGRTTIESAAEGLNISREFLQNIAVLLRQANIVGSYRGPGGGYELKQGVRVIDVLHSVCPELVLSQCDVDFHVIGSPESRALLFYSRNLLWQMSPMLQLSIKDIMADLVQDEMSHVNRLDVNGLEQ